MARQGQIYINKGIAQFARDNDLTTRQVSNALGRGETFTSIKQRGIIARGPNVVRAKNQPVGNGTGGTGGNGGGSIGAVYIPAKQKRAQGKQVGKQTLESRVGSSGPPILPPIVVTDEDLENLDGGSEGETFPQSRHRLEKAKADERELIVRQRRGELESVSRLNQWFSGCILRARDIFIRLGPELRDRLAATTDPAECERLVVEEINRGLDALKLYSDGMGLRNGNGNGNNHGNQASTEDEEDEG